MSEELEGPPEQKLVFPFDRMGEKWDLDSEMVIKPDSTWSMIREHHRYDYGHSVQYAPQHLPQDLQDLKKDDVIIVESGFLVEVGRAIHYGTVAHRFPGGRPIFHKEPHDVYSSHHLLSCDCEYLLRVVGAVQSQHFSRRTFDRTVRVKYSGRAMIDGYTRHLIRNEEMLKSWNRDFHRIYGG